MKQTILTVFFAIMSLGAHAQSPVSFQIKTGVGTSNFWGKSSDSNTRIAYKVGFGVEYELNKVWAIQSSLNFVSIGAKEDIESVGEANMNELYLQLPIMMAARLNFSKNYSAAISAGPYIAYGIGGKTSGKMDNYDYSSSYYPAPYDFRLNTFGNLIDDNMGNRRIDAGMIFGVHIEYYKFIFGAELQLGMVQVNDQLNSLLQTSGYYETFSPKNIASFFTVGYRF